MSSTDSSPSSSNHLDEDSPTTAAAAAAATSMTSEETKHDEHVEMNTNESDDIVPPLNNNQMITAEASFSEATAADLPLATPRSSIARILVKPGQIFRVQVDNEVKEVHGKNFFFFFFFSFSRLFASRSRKQTSSPFVDCSPVSVCSPVFIFIRRTPLDDGKFDTDSETDRPREKERKSALLKANASERANRAVAATNVPLFFFSSGLYRANDGPLSRSLFEVYVQRREKRREEKRREREREKKERRARVHTHTHTAVQCTLDNYDLWPKCVRVENIILSKDNRCHRSS